MNLAIYCKYVAKLLIAREIATKSYTISIVKIYEIVLHDPGAWMALN